MYYNREWQRRRLLVLLNKKVQRIWFSGVCLEGLRILGGAPEYKYEELEPSIQHRAMQRELAMDAIDRTLKIDGAWTLVTDGQIDQPLELSHGTIRRTKVGKSVELSVVVKVESRRSVFALTN